MSLAIGVGHVLPIGDEMLYQQTHDTGRSQTSSIVLRDIDRDLDGRLTDRYGINAVAKWSPDGQQIAYVTLNDTLFHVYVMDALGKNKRQLPLEFTTLDSGYVWSPDSQYILFSVSVKGIPQSLILKVASGQTYMLPQAIGLGMWSPHSKNIIYQASTENGTPHLYGININCFEQSQPCQFEELNILRNQAFNDIPSWSPDGHAIAFNEYNYGNSKIIVAVLRCVDLVEACVERYAVIGQGYGTSSPIWSANGNNLAFISGTSEMTIVQLATRETRTYLTPNIMSDLKDWSPTGQFIGYFSIRTGEINVYLLDTVGGESHPLFLNQITNELPEWRPNPH
ncbi:MAG: PD40 domain-containing protein [Anaerolineae bacterium]|nr:PD40 domain-containing protein [Anaerolineae bacterium]